MKPVNLKIVKDDQTTQSPALAMIQDALPPPIYAVAGEPIRARSGERLDVDGILARSLPKTLAETSAVQQEQPLSQI